jgi:hypothetical protein
MLEQPLLFDFREPDWERWVPITSTRNWMKEDPILDWLDLYGLQHGFMPDDQEPTYIREADFGEFIREKGRIFEARLLELLNARLDGKMERVAPSSSAARSPELYEKTIELMRAGVPAIASGVLWNFENQTYGVPDLLVRSDILSHLVETPPVHTNPDAPASALGLKSFHYVVVEIKYKKFDLLANYEPDNTTGHHKVQLALYNAALGSTQGFTPPQAYFLGRKWKKGSGKKLEESNSCLSRLVHVSLPIQDGSKPTDWLAKATEAVNWIKTLRQQGSQWQVLPKPSNKHLYPYMGNTQDAPWHSAKRQIADEIGEPTRIWSVGLPKRRELLEAGHCCDWRDSAFDLSLVAEEEGSKGPRIRKMIELNRSTEGLPYWPHSVGWATEEWLEPEPLEFYVDFETAGNLDDDFKSLPEAGGQPLIFMIGCGHWEPLDGNWSNPAAWMLDPAKRTWRFKVFYTNSLTEPDEKQIILDWSAYMEVLKRKIPGAPPSPKVFHWSPAEKSTFTSSSSSAFRRHLEPSEWPEPNWYDFLVRVVKPTDAGDAFFVRGAWGFGLKAIGKALFKHGLIQTEWKEGPADGLAAMSGCWACYRLAEEQNLPVTEVELTDVSGKSHRLFQEIIDYNEVDCRVMAESIELIRSLPIAP